MKRCPACERQYDDEMRLCGIDGTPLIPDRTKESEQDPIVGHIVKGRYQVLRKLGEGGMGSVYLAEQVSIGRKVALKLLRGNYASDEEFIARFRREARLAASLNHHNIVTIYDFDQGEDGSLFIAMEYIDGIKLSDIIRREGALAIERVVRLASQIAQGLDAAHQAGVIHRDIKPDNIMVSGVGRAEEVKLMDFGIARLRDTGTMQITRLGSIMGTPAYMAPEQAEGAEISEKTDIYAFGIVLYEMLSGSVPFTASTPAALLVKQIQETPKPLSVFRNETPASLERLVMQALEKKPEQRQRNMREVAARLQRQGVPAPIQSVPPTIATKQLSRDEREPSEDIAQINRPGEALRYARTEVMQIRDEAPETIAVTSVIRDTVIEHRKRPALKIAGVSVASLLFVVGIGFAIWQNFDLSPATIPMPVPQGLDNKIDTPPLDPVKPAVPPGPVGAPDTPVTPAPSSVERKIERPEVKPSESLQRRALSPISKPTAKPGSRPSVKAETIPPVVERSKPVISTPRTVVPVPVHSSPPLLDPNESAKSLAKIQEHIRVAKFFHSRGEYVDARLELEKARAMQPANEEVQAELVRVQRACEAERKILGRPGMRC